MPQRRNKKKLNTCYKAGDGIAKIIHLKEELTSLHKGLWGDKTNITRGEGDKKQRIHTRASVLTFQDAVDCRL